ncbi:MULTISPECIES: LysR family transcriptional regulator [Thalassospira]|uniref:LysR family transcriptional regulator n=2 Tax=Thalassospira TaxID=168934 RepID=A0A367WAK9_9PROT|nr:MULTISPECIES: LysR family transcriptional regulator [Thalassospira]MDG4720021.1 LysR family transcriptional regulator [Thalassospira sp. FZY0004]RCK38458.1 LysR family transcriptional regulator [Thalassospira profundimaris]
MDRFNAMQVFVRVAEEQGFAAAARALNMSPAAVTRTIAQLEDIIGARLLTRTTRTVTMTEAGVQYLADCKRLLADLHEVEAAAGGAYAKPSGVLRITAPVQFGQMHIAPIVGRYLDQYPDMRAHLLLFDRIVNIVEEGIDLAVRIGHLADSSLSAVRLGQVRQVVCGAPEYFERTGFPLTPADLATHRIVASTGSSARLDWHFKSPTGGRNIHLSPDVKWQTNSIEAAREATMNGWGIMRMLSYQAAPFIAGGKLITVLDDYRPDPVPVHLVHPEGRHAPAKVRSFIDLAVETLRSNPVLNSN